MRAQTTIDFAIGISLFLVVVAFVVAFVPTIFTPFESTESPGTADRIATSLGTDRLGDPAEPYVLNGTCTDAFFEQLESGTDAPGGCLYNTSADTTAALFGLSERDVNVTIRRPDGTIADRPGGKLAAGPTPPETASVSAATRVVSLSGESRRLLVRTW
jgi:hypothetical protein